MDTQLAALIGLAVLLAQVLSKVVDVVVDKKRNGHFTAADRAALDQMRDSSHDVLAHVQRHTDAVRELAFEMKTVSTQQATLAQARSDRDRDLFQLMQRVLEKVNG